MVDFGDLDLGYPSISILSGLISGLGAAVCMTIGRGFLIFNRQISCFL